MKKIPIWKNVVLILAVIFGIMLATFAWFYTGPTGDAKALVVPVGKATYVQVSGDNGDTWSDDLDVEIGVNNTFKEISGNGTTFYSPVYEVVGSDADLPNSSGFSTQIVAFENVEKHYYERTFEFRSDIKQQIYLKPVSYVSAVDAEGAEIKSYINGAVRVAFFEVDDGVETLKYIWAPNSKIQYLADENAFTEDGDVESNYFYQKSGVVTDPSSVVTSNAHLAVVSAADTDENGCGYNAANKFLWSNGENLPANTPALLTLDNQDPTNSDKHYCKTLKIKVWLEGHDRECVSLLSGQSFTMKLEFLAMEGE